jgi:hypothetical protein
MFRFFFSSGDFYGLFTEGDVCRGIVVIKTAVFRRVGLLCALQGLGILHNDSEGLHY